MSEEGRGMSRQQPSRQHIVAVKQQRGHRSKGGMAQGRDRKPRGAMDKRDFCSICLGSLEEPGYWAISGRGVVSLADGADPASTLDKVGRMMHGLVVAIPS